MDKPGLAEAIQAAFLAGAARAMLDLAPVVDQEILEAAKEASDAGLSTAFDVGRVVSSRVAFLLRRKAATFSREAMEHKRAYDKAIAA